MAENIGQQNQTFITDTNKCIYLCGGVVNNQYKQKCIKYDENRDDWQPISDMIYQRLDFSLIASNNKLYAIGGYNVTVVGGNELKTIETYDPRSNTWQLSKPLILKRYKMAASVIDSKIYVCGGLNNYTAIKSCEIYSIDTNSIEFSEPMIYARYDFQLVANNNYLYAIGGSSSSVEKFDLKTGQWTLIQNTNYRRTGFGATILFNNIYVCGGVMSKNTCEKFDCNNNNNGTWKTIDSLKTERDSFQIINLNNKIFALGSRISPYESTVEIYDHKSDQWFQSDSLPYRVYYHSVAVL
ncbi:kelch-like protein diablo [Oppia nitens]|uniref:kelch-like protein diablo n=1 Tax=Oppia nitens TaxID=1686743 RepID=UPI0023DAFA5E|nr:kelch-like protein diablo [Oppia nitens]